MAKKIRSTPPSAGCLLTDVSSIPIARGELRSPATADLIQLVITESAVKEFPNDTILQVIPKAPGQKPRMARIVRQREQMLVLEPLRSQHTDMRQNLRVPVDFLSYVYPWTGGRYPIRAHDLSCGGIAFYCLSHFKINDQLEVVIPITVPNPLILRGQVLRISTREPPAVFYACQFYDIINDEECRVREAVFNIQLCAKPAIRHQK